MPHRMAAVVHSIQQQGSSTAASTAWVHVVGTKRPQKVSSISSSAAQVPSNQLSSNQLPPWPTTTTSQYHLDFGFGQQPKFRQPKRHYTSRKVDSSHHTPSPVPSHHTSACSGSDANEGLHEHVAGIIGPLSDQEGKEEEDDVGVDCCSSTLRCEVEYEGQYDISATCERLQSGAYTALKLVFKPRDPTRRQLLFCAAGALGAVQPACCQPPQAVQQGRQEGSCQEQQQVWQVQQVSQAEGQQGQQGCSREPRQPGQQQSQCSAQQQPQPQQGAWRPEQVVGVHSVVQQLGTAWCELTRLEVACTGPLALHPSTLSAITAAWPHLQHLSLRFQRATSVEWVMFSWRQAFGALPQTLVSLQIELEHEHKDVHEQLQQWQRQQQQLPPLQGQGTQHAQHAQHAPESEPKQEVPLLQQAESGELGDSGHCTPTKHVVSGRGGPYRHAAPDDDDAPGAPEKKRPPLTFTAGGQRSSAQDDYAKTDADGSAADDDDDAAVCQLITRLEKLECKDQKKGKKGKQKAAPRKPRPSLR